MRIGNIDDLEKTGNADNLISIMQSADYRNLSRAEKRRNWWHYHKWHVVCGIILSGIACNLIGKALGLWEKSPDFQIAYVGSRALPEDTVSALEEAFASLEDSSCLDFDFNKDGKVTIQVNQYASDHSYADTEAVYYAMVSEVTLMSDITNCESYFFLMENPDTFQRQQQVLANPDGSRPDHADYSADGKVILWSDCPALSEITALVEAKAPGSREILSGLYLGRRCFSDNNNARTKHAEQCSELWDWIIGR